MNINKTYGEFLADKAFKMEEKVKSHKNMFLPPIVQQNLQDFESLAKTIQKNSDALISGNKTIKQVFNNPELTDEQAEKIAEMEMKNEK